MAWEVISTTKPREALLSKYREVLKRADEDEPAL